MRIFSLIYLFFLASAFIAAQEGGFNRGSIPEELLRPKRGEAPRYPVDTIIGELGQGTARNEAYSLARSIMSGLMSADMEHRGLSEINSAVREGYLSALEVIHPTGYRLGGGREEPDGATSFMVRFIGRDQGITGELYVRYVTKQIEKPIKIDNTAKSDDINISEAGFTAEDETAASSAASAAALENQGELAEETADSTASDEEEAKVEVITTGSWMFDDLILEEARSREEEKRDEVQRFDFSPYERFF